MNTFVATGTFRLKGRQLYANGFVDRRIKNIQELADRSGMTYPTAYRWVEKPDELTSISLENLYGFLVDGLGFSPEDVTKMSIGDIFELVARREAGAK